MHISSDTDDRLKCDRCGSIFLYDDEIFQFTDFVDSTLFRRRPKPSLPDLCLPCAKEVSPLIYALRDIDELTLFVNNLERAINGKRKQGTQDNRATENNAC